MNDQELRDTTDAVLQALHAARQFRDWLDNPAVEEEHLDEALDGLRGWIKTAAPLLDKLHREFAGHLAGGTTPEPVGPIKGASYHDLGFRIAAKVATHAADGAWRPPGMAEALDAQNSPLAGDKAVLWSTRANAAESLRRFLPFDFDELRAKIENESVIAERGAVDAPAERNDGDDPDPVTTNELARAFDVVGTTVTRWLQDTPEIDRRGNQKVYDYRVVRPVLLELKISGARSFKGKNVPHSADGIRDMDPGP